MALESEQIKFIGKKSYHMQNILNINKIKKHLCKSSAHILATKMRNIMAKISSSNNKR